MQCFSSSTLYIKQLLRFSMRTEDLHRRAHHMSCQHLSGRLFLQRLCQRNDLWLFLRVFLFFLRVSLFSKGYSCSARYLYPSCGYWQVRLILLNCVVESLLTNFVADFPYLILCILLFVRATDFNTLDDLLTIHSHTCCSLYVRLSFTWKV